MSEEEENCFEDEKNCFEGEEEYFKEKNYWSYTLLIVVFPLLVFLPFSLMLHSAVPIFFVVGSYIGAAIFAFKGKVYRFGRWLQKWECVMQGIIDLFFAIGWALWAYSEFYC